MSLIQDATAPSAPQVRRDFVPKADYSEQFHRLEMERIWPRVWQVACREEEIPEVGDYVNYEIGHESILVVRSAPGTIRAFYNVCPHRGRRLRDDARGNLSLIFCGYHAWTFDLDGKPATIPSREDWKGCPASSDEDFSLNQVKADTWAGWVWINMDPDCEPLLNYLGPLPERLDALEWEHCRIRSYQTIIFPINWKVAIEAFVEPYHVVGTHPQLLRWGHGRAAGLEEYLAPGYRHGGHTGARSYTFDERAEFKDPREYIASSALNTYHQLHGVYHEEGKRAAQRLLDEVPAGLTLQEASARYAALRREEIIKSGARFPESVTADHLRVIEWLIFPNSSVLTTVEGAFWYRSRPNGDDPNLTIFDIYSLGRFAPGKEPKVSQEFYQTLAEFKGKNPILEQDFSNMIAVQKGIRSRGWKGARPNPIEESNVSNFHRVLHSYVYGMDEWGGVAAER
jgi:phenylpropionate dioxygenase-like ring-hydroxylating dioxygenase large terminal subunit